MKVKALSPNKFSTLATAVQHKHSSERILSLFMHGQTQTKVHLELIKQHVHGRGLGEQRRSVTVLLQASQGHPVERRVRKTGRAAD